MSADQFMPNDAVVATIRHDVDTYNQLRVTTAKSVRLRLWLFHGLFTLVAAWVAFLVFDLTETGLFSNATWFVFLFILLGYMGAHWLALWPAKRLQQSFRDSAIPRIFSFLDQVDYRHGAKPKSLEYLPKQAIGTYNREEFDDCIYGRHQDMAFEAFEAKFNYKAGKGSARLVFRGVVLAFQLAKPFPAKLIARIRTPPAGGFTRFMQQLFGSGDLDEVAIGDPKVDGTYEFRSDNAVRARHLVTPDFTYALDQLGRAWPDAPGRVVIAGESGFVLLPTTRNFFELPNIDETCDYQRHIEPMVSDLAKLLDIARLVRRAAD
jgi:hypothetical protein